MDSTSGDAPAKHTFSPRRVALLVVPLAIVCALTIKVTADRIVDRAKKDSEQSMLKWFELSAPTPRLLDAQFSDKDDNLVADAPEDPKQQIEPETLRFSYIGGPDAKDEMAMWEEFIPHLEKATGKKIETVTYETTDAQLAALAKGELHITGINTGAVPVAVASCGFVPAFTFGEEDGKFGVTMQIIVPADSPIKTIDDFKTAATADGERPTFTFTTRDSNSGCKAALTLLRDHDLLPLRDYLWKFSGSHEESIEGIVAGNYQAAAVASDLLKRAVADGKADADKFRVIHESERFPPATLGFVYFLPPELTGKIRTAFEDYDWEGTSLQSNLASSGAKRFVPVSYKQDFALIRRIDGALRKPSTLASK